MVGRFRRFEKYMEPLTHRRTRQPTAGTNSHARYAQRKRRHRLQYLHHINQGLHEVQDTDMLHHPNQRFTMLMSGTLIQCPKILGRRAASTT